MPYRFLISITERACRQAHSIRFQIHQYMFMHSVSSYQSLETNAKRRRAGRNPGAQAYYDVERNGEPIKDVKHYYIATHSMKLLKSISLHYNIDLVDLMTKFGGEQMLRCQHPGAKPCTNLLVCGQYYCQHHRKLHSFAEGLDTMLNK